MFSYSFDGDYKRRPMQSLGGHSMSTNRDSIIKKSQEQRQKRSEMRKQNQSSINIQSYVRSFLTRKHIKTTERNNFDEFVKLRKKNLETNFDANEISYVIQRFVFFFDSDQDSDRLIFICKFLVKHTQKIIELMESSPQWCYRLREICNICLQQLSSTSSGSHAIPMRIIEIFTNIKFPTSKKILVQLVEQKYFDKVRKILEIKCPPLDGETLRPPDPTTQAIFEMIMRPLSFTDAENYSDICLKFSECFLSQKPSEPISCYIIPTLSQPEFAANFPYTKIIEALGEILPPTADDSQMDVDLVKGCSNPEQIFTSYLFKHILTLDRNLELRDFSDYKVCSSYLAVLSYLSQHLLKLPKSSVRNKLMELGALKVDLDDSANEDYDSDSDNEGPSTKNQGEDLFETNVLLDVVDLLYKPNRVTWILQNQTERFSDSPKQLYQISVLCHNFLLMSNFNSVSNFELFNISNIPKFLRSLWFTLVNQSNKLGFNSPLALISKGVIPKADTDIERTIPFLATFCAIYSKRLPMMHDDDFSSKMDENPLPFALSEIVQLCKILKEISLGLVELAFPETRTNLNNHYRNVLGRSDADNERIKQKQQVWAHLLNVVVCVINQLYNRDLRMNFCPDGAWILENLNLTLDKDWDVPLVRARRGHRPFEPIKDFTRKDFDNGPPPSTKQLRSVTILREIPFVVSFARRVNILQGLIASDKMKIQGGLHAFLQGPVIHLSVRRSHLYEDSFDKLRPENEPELRHVMKIQFVSSLGLEEIGIDGGGVFREYINELLKTAFDPNRGFFMLTTDNKLYPNPNVADLVENYEKHYEFIGRILGKAIYENLRVELPLAECFLTKLAGRKYSTHDMHQLASLDPELYKHLLSLKSNKDIDTLGLDFSIVTSSFGNSQVKVHELKPGGQNILVSSHNINEYIGLVADFKLSKQIHKQCKAFRRGLSNLLPIEWLNMFSNKELQILISGTEIPIDLEDLKNNCRYGADYSPDHPTIQCFWRVVEEFDEDQKRQLLKFVTSSTRPPLNGFKDLEPPFSIQNTNDEDRLPTASTCTNLLKLPPFKNDDIMREKLLYAIESGAGFELS